MSKTSGTDIRVEQSLNSTGILVFEMESQKPLRVAFVPEHFSTPLYFAQKYFGLSAQLIPFPSGTGHMITALRAGEVDVGIGLTEGWVAGLGKQDIESDGGYRIVGTYVETPLCMPQSITIGEIGGSLLFRKLKYEINPQAGRSQRAQKGKLIVYPT